MAMRRPKVMVCVCFIREGPGPVVGGRPILIIWCAWEGGWETNSNASCLRKIWERFSSWRRRLGVDTCNMACDII